MKNKELIKAVGFSLMALFVGMFALAVITVLVDVFVKFIGNIYAASFGMTLVIFVLLTYNIYEVLKRKQAEVKPKAKIKPKVVRPPLDDFDEDKEEAV